MNPVSYLFYRPLRCFSALVLVTTAISTPVLAFNPSEGEDLSAPAPMVQTPRHASRTVPPVARSPMAEPATVPVMAPTETTLPPAFPMPVAPRGFIAPPPALPSALPSMPLPQSSMQSPAPHAASHLPSTSLLTGEARQRQVISPRAQLVLTDSATLAQAVPAPEPTMVIPSLPSTAALEESAATPAPAPVPVMVTQPEEPGAQRAPSVMFPHVDAQTLQRAHEIQAAASPSGYIAPPPLISGITGLPEPLVQPSVPMSESEPPMAATSVPPSIELVEPEPAVETVMPATPKPPGLSADTRAILSRIPSKLDSGAPAKKGNIALDRIDPTVQSLASDNVDAYEASGIKISVRRPGLDTNYELGRAYTALAGGDSQTAMSVYQNILSTEPNNADALFGLAALYHREGNFPKARSFYGRLLKQYPTHRAGLTNFLALVADESPEDALLELAKLEQRDPEFSPIPAQEALVLSKMGRSQEAAEKMVRAIELAPNNMTYKYNLAVILDGQGSYAEASQLYRLLVDAATRGQPVPAPLDSLQKRLNYIATMDTTQNTRMPDAAMAH